MGTVSRLKLVEKQAPFRREFQVARDGSEFHSLHSAVTSRERTPPDIAALLIKELSKAGDVVLDPFCGNGTVPLEAALQGRIPYASDRSALSVIMTEGFLSPGDIAEVTLFLQLMPVTRPVDTRLFSEEFKPFYDLDTFREILNLRRALTELARSDNCPAVLPFVRSLALSLLHGNSAGYFSTYTFPQVSISPHDQDAVNIRRGQRPDYRAIVPRLLRKCAMVSRDGFPSAMRRMVSRAKVGQSDARDLNYLSSASVDCVVTTPPMPGEQSNSKEYWLRQWFSGITEQSPVSAAPSLDEWGEFMNEVLVELARVVRPHGYTAIHIPSLAGSTRKATVRLVEQELNRLCEEDLASFWDVEGVIEAAQPKAIPRLSELSQAVVVLRRR